MTYIEGHARDQALLLPAAVEDYVAERSPAKREFRNNGLVPFNTLAENHGGSDLLRLPFVSSNSR
jgi:hypothetical protein